MVNRIAGVYAFFGTLFWAAVMYGAGPVDAFADGNWALYTAMWCAPFALLLRVFAPTVRELRVALQEAESRSKTCRR